MIEALIATLPLAAPDPPRVVYEIDVDVRTRRAQVEMRIDQSEGQLPWVEFRRRDEHFHGFDGDGVEVGPEWVRWEIPPKGGVVSWSARLNHVREERSYDARITPSWALFRGTDVVPLFSYPKKAWSKADGHVDFDLPVDWQLVTRQGVISSKKAHPLVDEGPVPAPRGWVLVGEVEVVPVDLEDGGEIILASPGPHEHRHHETAAFLRLLVPHFRDLIGRPLGTLLVVRADDPMWRGGLSGPGSTFVHADRPLVTADATSPLLHEIFHVITSARSREDSDWIVEGLAEWTTLEVLARAGALSEREEARAWALHEKRGEEAHDLLDGPSTGDETHRAVTILRALDQLIERESDEKQSLDDVVRKMVRDDPTFTTAEFIAMTEDITGLETTSFFERHGVLPKEAEEKGVRSEAEQREEVSNRAHASD